MIAPQISSVMAIACAPDGQTLALACGSAVLIADAHDGTVRRVLTGHLAMISTMAFSPDGHTLATSADDNTIRLWDATLAEEIAILVPLPDGGHAVVLPDGSYSLDGEAQGRFWWVIGNHRFEVGELDDHVPAVRRLAPGTPIPRPQASRPQR
ncbi:hypothetical protein FRACA_770025 [Frankia canadensis]|uniref:Uncharacterized protein n=1 Tax=Frankia canadensis TaxID=1836972 RepID=A0A2I2L132_9ACTN|nr:hypothetical protein [Frankia canadensis]SNQ51642.1 hypothetical protein FRACA_770025 [Frankia canadensis]SOU58932.1 hypothetical protein FRACA_770025 [Frankia canadensis]